MGAFFNPFNPGKCRQTSAFNRITLGDEHNLHCEIVFSVFAQPSDLGGLDPCLAVCEATPVRREQSYNRQ
jgi:hypothetical protein